MKIRFLISIIKKILYAGLLIIVGIIIQNRLDVMQEIVDWENSLFHEEEYDFVLNILPVGQTSSIMGVRGQVLYSYRDYNAKLLMPKEYHISNKKPENGIVEKEGYYTYTLKNFRKKYRDLCSYDGLKVTPESADIAKHPVYVILLEGKDIKYESDVYSIETKNTKVILTKLESNKEKQPIKNRCFQFKSNSIT